MARFVPALRECRRYLNATVFLNGKQIVHHEGWSEAFDAPLDAARRRFYRARFTTAPPGAPGPHPILRVISRPRCPRGFVWLNGHNLGRYPEKIPVNGLYLPECWLRRGENALMIFDEDGRCPDGVTLTVEAAAGRTVTEIGPR